MRVRRAGAGKRADRSAALSRRWPRRDKMAALGPLEGIMRRARLLLSAVLLLGCTPEPPVPSPAAQPQPGQVTSIKIDGVDYRTPREALEAMKRSIDAAVAGLPKESDPLRGKVRVVLPDHDRMRPVLAQLLAQRLKR